MGMGAHAAGLARGQNCSTKENKFSLLNDAVRQIVIRHKYKASIERKETPSNRRYEWADSIPVGNS